MGRIIKDALKTLREAGYRIRISKGGKSKVKTQFVKLSKAFRRKGHLRKAHRVKTTKALRIHSYWRKPRRKS